MRGKSAHATQCAISRALIKVLKAIFDIDSFLCVYVTGLPAVYYDQIMRWWGYNLGQ